MAIIRNAANTLRKGKVGDTTYYVSKGRQIARQALNNSNYGENARRSPIQMERRVRWANLVDLYKALRPAQTSAYENKQANQSDYNRFMQLNVNSAQICLTKEQALEGCAVIDTVRVSSGSLPSLGDGRSVFAEYDTFTISGLKTNIRWTSANTDFGEMTVDAFTSQLLADNPDFKRGDGICIVSLEQLDGENASADVRPYVRLIYDEFVLPTTTLGANVFVPDTSLENIVRVVNGFLVFSHADRSSYRGAAVLGQLATAVIHVRKGDSLRVSTEILDTLDSGLDDTWGATSAPNWMRQCMESYGVNHHVLIYPDGSQSYT